MSIIISIKRKLPHRQQIKKGRCHINEEFLSNLGFSLVICDQIQDTKTYRYYHQNDQGFDVIYSEEFNVLTVEEFGYDDAGRVKINNKVVGMFHIQFPEDLDFIFSRNVRLNYVFNTSKKKVFSCY